MLSLLLFLYGRPVARKNPWLRQCVVFRWRAEVQLFFAHLQYLAPTTCLWMRLPVARVDQLPAIGLMVMPPGIVGIHIIGMLTPTYWADDHPML